jgi:hypothetical protein
VFSSGSTPFVWGIFLGDFCVDSEIEFISLSALNSPGQRVITPELNNGDVVQTKDLVVLFGARHSRGWLWVGIGNKVKSVNEEPLEVDLQNIFFVFFSSLSKLSKPPNKNVRTVKSREELLADCRLRDGEKLFHPSTSLSRFRNKKLTRARALKLLRSRVTKQFFRWSRES